MTDGTRLTTSTRRQLHPFEQLGLLGVELRLGDHAPLPQLVEAARDGNARLAFVGGAGSTLVAEGGPRLVDTDGFPEEYKPEALAHGEVLDALRADDSGLQWFYVSPAAGFGAWAAGEATGSYRTSADVLLADAEGNSAISGADFAKAFIDEIEDPQFENQRFHVAY